MDYVNYGHAESRRGQARLHEELGQREKGLRDTRIKSIHEVKELKRVQEMRIDEFSRNELRESHATLRELTSQIQELQGIMNYMNDSREMHEIESIWSGKLHHVSSQLAVVPSPQSMLSRDQSLRSDTWNLSGTQGNVFGHPRTVIDSSQTLYAGILHFMNQIATGGNTVQNSTRRPVAKGEEQIGRPVPMPIFAAKPSTMNSFLPAISMAGPQIIQISELQFEKFTTPSSF